ncbi:MAG: isopeptide-forming domain-containing fimbrial protein, partial [Nonomuraea sp.]|nr:isopeptide-forming domain-containing fimbrial protein [Nonomuraea sp.]
MAAAILATLGLVAASPATAASAPGDPRSSVSITKTNDTGGDPLEPGDDFVYTLNGQCSGLTVDCVDFTVTDTLPAGLEVTSLPQSTTIRDVTYNESTRKLTVVYKQPLQNPSGETGLRAGQAGAIEIGMRVPADTQLDDGTVITNTARVAADNADPDTSSTDVTISIPRVVKPVATKTWEDGSAVAGSGETSTITLDVRNNSSSSAEVTELSVSDTTEETFEYFDFRSATVTKFPKGADGAHLVVTTADGQTHTGPTITKPGRL